MSAARRRPSAGPDLGQGLVEYALVIVGIALVATVILVVFPDQVSAGLDLIGDAIDRATR